MVRRMDRKVVSYTKYHNFEKKQPKTGKKARAGLKNGGYGVILSHPVIENAMCFQAVIPPDYDVTNPRKRSPAISRDAFSLLNRI